MNILHQSEKDRPFGIRTYAEILQEGLEYIQDRQSGKISSFKLPWNGVNKVGIGGLEWGSMFTLGARPGAGKTLCISQVIRESKIHNPNQEFNILEFQFEMGPKQTASRDFVAQTGLDYNEVLSTYKAVDEFSIKIMKNYVEECKRLQLLGTARVQINNSLTVRQMEEAIYTAYSGLGGKPLIVSIDHSWLIKKDRDEREKINTLYNTVEMLMQVKNKLPLIVLMITQLNRSIDEPIRKIPGSISNYPTSSDIFGGDALMQGSDMVGVLNRPYKADIEIYGRKEYECKSNDLFLHILKSRNSSDDANIIFMQADFAKQRIIEVPEFLSRNPGGSAPIRRTANRFQQNEGPQ